MAADKPHPPSPAESDPATVAHTFRKFVRLLGMIQAEWKRGDRRMISWVASGMSPYTSGFETIVCQDERSRLRQLQTSFLRDGIVPVVLPFCDPNLRDHIQRLMRIINVDSYQLDFYEEKSQRWRQTWEATGLTEEFAEIIPKLHAAASRVEHESRTHKTTSDASASLRADRDPKAPYMPPRWYSVEFGIGSERLRAARRANRIAAINISTEGAPARYHYSVRDAIRLWPDDVTYVPETQGNGG